MSCGKEPAVEESAAREGDRTELAVGFCGVSQAGGWELNEQAARTHTAPAPQMVWVTRIGISASQL